MKVKLHNITGKGMVTLEIKADTTKSSTFLNLHTSEVFELGNMIMAESNRYLLEQEDDFCCGDVCDFGTTNKEGK